MEYWHLCTRLRANAARYTHQAAFLLNVDAASFLFTSLSCVDVDVYWVTPCHEESCTTSSLLRSFTSFILEAKLLKVKY
jgi:hypothetical protein